MTENELDRIRELSLALHEILLICSKMIEPGSTVYSLKEKTISLLHKTIPGSKLFSFDMNINKTICHGNSDQITASEGDIITLDVVIHKDGLYADEAWSSICGKGSPERIELLHKAWEISRKAVLSIKNNDTSLMMKKEIHNSLAGSRFSIIEEACGHGIGRSMHMAPDINFSILNKEDLLWKTGMVFTIEPVLSLEGAKLLQSKEKDWITDNLKDSAYFEHMVAINEMGTECLNIPEINLLNSIDIF